MRSSVVRVSRWIFLLWTGLGMGAQAESGAGEAPSFSPDQIAFFENKIRPILANHCVECHSAQKNKVKGGLSLDSREEILRGGEGGAALRAGAPSESRLIRAVEWGDDLQMPPKKKLGAEQIEDLKRWVEWGAPDPRKSKAEPVRKKGDHWAFQPVRRPELPVVRGRAWVKNPVDLFVLAKLEARGMVPAEAPETGSPEAVRQKKEAVLRRAYFDLIGLPPSPAQIERFVQDPSPDAFSRVIDSLLANPAYGERWARHWMDTARYSDTTGVGVYGAEYRYPYAWGYRDWLIKAFNEDMPYDEFVTHQLAADLVSKQPNRNWAALGFITTGTKYHYLAEDETINDRIDVVGRGLLGLTLTCARCHDHKFDPLTQADYYALKGVFKSVGEPKDCPAVEMNSDRKSLIEYEQELAKLREKAYAAYFHVMRWDATFLRAQPALVFEYAALLEQPIQNEGDHQKRAEFAKARGMDRSLEYWIRSHFAPNFTFNIRDPIFGPFVMMLKSSDPGMKKRLDAALSGKSTISYNPVVIRYLKEAGSLPSDIAGTAALFGKFWNETVDPVAGERVVDLKNPEHVRELEKGGIYRKIWELRGEVAQHPDRPLMELAAFPWRLIAPRLELRGADSRFYSADDPIEEKLRAEVGAHQYQGSWLLEVAVNPINVFKLSAKAAPVRAMVLSDLPKPVNCMVLPRGNKPGPGEPAAPVVPRRFIEALSPGGATPFREGSGRMELAQAIVSPQNPLTARVMVNRVWMYHFGEGLVRTPDDLGNNAGEPSHPELLDFLASWFMEEIPASKPGGVAKKAWSIKSLHKAMMLSNAYQQSSWSASRSEYEKLDPANTLLWRANVRRLDFEAFRDSLLVMAGEQYMDRTMYGPPVNLVSEPFSLRRTVYGYIDRGNVPELLNHFDMANPQEPNTRRNSTTVPQQALFLMNSPFTIGIVQKVTKRPDVVAAAARGYREAIRAIYHVVFQRSPTPVEYLKAEQFLKVESERQRGVLQSQRDSLQASALSAEEKLRKDLLNVNRSNYAAIVNRGELVQRVPLTAWETFVQALMFCNEATYLN